MPKAERTACGHNRIFTGLEEVRKPLFLLLMPLPKEAANMEEETSVDFHWTTRTIELLITSSVANGL
jgi:hypothetical protein